MSSPFKKAYYEALIEGLEVSEVKLSDILAGAETLRFDPEYYQKKYIADEKIVAGKRDEFVAFSDLEIRVDASAFYPSIEDYYGEGDLPFLRVADVDTVIDFKNCTTIPAEVCSRFSTLSKVFPGDIVFTKGGSVARIGLVTEEAAVSRDLIFLNSAKLEERDRVFLYLYFQTGFFYRSLIRSSSQTAQPHLTLTLVRELPVFLASSKFKDLCAKIVTDAFEARARSLKLLDHAEQKLSTQLGLQKLPRTDPLTYVGHSSVTFAADRFDAEFFKPKFNELNSFIDSTGKSQRLGDLLVLNKRGKQPIYAEKGLRVVNSKHVNGGDVRIDADNRLAIPDEDALVIRKGDVLINGTGVGTIGRSAPYLHPQEALPDNHVTILRAKAGGIDPVYLAAFLNSRAGQLQVEQRLRGSSGQIEIYPSDIAEFKIWLAPKPIQLAIRKSVEDGFIEKRRSAALLSIAKRAVEIAIEVDERAATEYLKKEISGRPDVKSA